MSGFEIAMAVGTAISTIAGVAGLAQQASAQKAAGEQARIAGEAQARVAEQQAKVRQAQAVAMEQEAGQERARGQRAAMDERRQQRLLEGDVRAAAVASGGGSLDPSIVNILGDIGTEGEVRALTRLYGGEEAARGLEHGAALERAGAEGDLFAAQTARQAGEAERSLLRGAARRSYLSAGGTLFGGLSRVGAIGARRIPSGTTLEGDFPDNSLFSKYAFG